MKTERRWYVITTRSRAEKKVGVQLEKLGIGCFVPLQKQLRQWKDRKKWVEVPLLAPYVFVQVEPRYRNEVFQVPGVLKFVMVAGEPAVFSPEEVQRVRDICASGFSVTVRYDHFDVGDEVEVTEGILSGLRGRLTSEANGTKLHVRISGIGCMASITIDRNTVRKIGSTGNKE